VHICNAVSAAKCVSTVCCHHTEKIVAITTATAVKASALSNLTRCYSVNIFLSEPCQNLTVIPPSAQEKQNCMMSSLHRLTGLQPPIWHCFAKQTFSPTMHSPSAVHVPVLHKLSAVPSGLQGVPGAANSKLHSPVLGSHAFAASN
jgi:hypothetical protein